MTRLAKQLLFGGIYLAIILGIGWWGYRLFVPAPTCSDGIRNGGEDGVDCGAKVCGRLCAPAVRPLEEPTVKILENSDGSWDVLATLENPNAAYGTARVDYTLTVTDASGAELAVRRGRTYANPAQPRVLVFPLGKPASDPASAVLQLDQGQIEWAALEIDAAGSVEFAIRADALTTATASARYEANVINRSRFDFTEVDVTVLLYDAAGKAVGAGSTVVRTLLAGEERAFVVDWPFAVPGAVRGQPSVSTNIFSNENYIREHGTDQRF